MPPQTVCVSLFAGTSGFTRYSTGLSRQGLKGGKPVRDLDTLLTLVGQGTSGKGDAIGLADR